MMTTRNRKPDDVEEDWSQLSTEGLLGEREMMTDLLSADLPDNQRKKYKAYVIAITLELSQRGIIDSDSEEAEETLDKPKGFAGTVRNPMRNRTFYVDDNLDVLVRMPDESVDLIATDPPFNKNKEFQGIGKSEGASFKDYWSWQDDVHVPYLEHIREHWTALNEVIEAAYEAHSSRMAAFLAFMSVRLIEMHRILKPTGSLYLHCDPTANAYLRLMLDSIFTRQFRNEIVWRKYGGHKNTASRKFTTETDTILWYTKSDNYVFNKVYRPLKESTLKEYKHTDENGRRYAIPRGRQYRQGNVQRVYLDEHTGVAVGTLWVERELTIQGHDNERQGWPTQKPLALYRRIIDASSNPGDLVLDPFAGCATTCVAAEQAGRAWIGIDISPKAEGITLDRLKKECGAGTLWASKVRILASRNLPQKVKGTTADLLSVPKLPERKRERSGGVHLSAMRGRLAAREAAGTSFGHYNEACQGCGFTTPPGRLEYLDVDHIDPFIEGGPDEIDNRCLLCPPCNRRKAHKLSIDALRAEIRAHNLMLNESRLVDMDSASIAKRDRATQGATSGRRRR